MPAPKDSSLLLLVASEIMKPNVKRMPFSERKLVPLAVNLSHVDFTILLYFSTNCTKPPFADTLYAMAVTVAFEILISDALPPALVKTEVLRSPAPIAAPPE